MINKNFYPTPDWVGKLMMAPYEELLKKEYIKVLEPSAGKGDLIKAIQRYFPGTIYAIEIEGDLQAILNTKEKVKLVGSDFLSFNAHIGYQLIVMNPPFDKGVDHVLKAWEVSMGGDIVSLINHETINNPFSEKRKFLKRLIDQYGSYELIGSAFQDAERKTGVQIGIIRLKKPLQDFEDYGIFSGLEKEVSNISIDFENPNPVATNNLVGSMVASYEEAKKSVIGWITATEKLRFHTSSFSKGEAFSSLMEALTTASEQDPIAGYNLFSNSLNSSAWTWVLKNTKSLQDLLTSKVAKQFSEEISKMKTIPFTEDNVRRVIENIMMSAPKIFKECVVDAHDRICSFSAQTKPGGKDGKQMMPIKLEERSSYQVGLNTIIVISQGTMTIA